MNAHPDLSAAEPRRWSRRRQALAWLGACAWLSCDLACERSREPAASESGRTVSTPAATTAPLLRVSSSAGASTQPLVDLLHETAVEVAVSSHANYRAVGQLLVDEDVQTAWRPNPPDPSPWVHVRLPEHTSVRRIEAVWAEPEPAAAAPSVKEGNRVINGRWERTANTSSFVPERPIRDSLHIEWAERGTLPTAGVAELRVLGEISTPAAALTRAQPQVNVGAAVPSFRGEPTWLAPWWRAAPFESSAALCAALADRDPQTRCAQRAPLDVEGSAPRGVNGVHVQSLSTGTTDEPRSLRVLVVDTRQGWFPFSTVLDVDQRALMGDHRGSTLYLVRVERARWRGEVLELEVLRRLSIAQAPEAQNLAALQLLSCRVGHSPPPNAAPVCHDAWIAFGDADPQGHLVAVDMNPEKFRPSSWLWRRDYALLPSGQIRLMPCVTETGTSVPCHAAQAAELP